jgi:hypothetical protein
MVALGLGVALSAAAAACSGGGGSGANPGGGGGIHCVEYNSKGTVVACLGFSNLSATAASAEDMACLDDAGGAGAGGGHGVLASSCPSGATGCCYTQQSAASGDVGDFQCYYGAIATSSLQSICSGVPNTMFTSSPPF